MKLSDLREQRQAASSAASNQARTFALAGLGIVWLFVSDFFTRKSHLEPSDSLLLAGAAFTATLLFDLAQLLGRAVVLFFVFRNRENSASSSIDQQGDAADIDDVGPWPLRVTTPFFFLKFTFLLIGYVLVAIYFATQI